MRKIEKKVWPQFFEKITSGDKTFDIRLADFECAPGDILVLREWNPESLQYTGRKTEKEVTYVAKTKGFTFWSQEDVEKYGFQVIGFR
ncbi:MAG: DUF3850 domain-containing protein [bacterium]|nr:DUF3850 domain-containing protein [bacterium]